MSFSPFRASTGHFIFFMALAGSYLIKWRYHGEVHEIIWVAICCTVLMSFSSSDDMVLVTFAYNSFWSSSVVLSVCCSMAYLFRTDGFIPCQSASGIPWDLEIISTCFSIRLSPLTPAPANETINAIAGSLAATMNAMIPPALCPIMPIFFVFISFLPRR